MSIAKIWQQPKYLWMGRWINCGISIQWNMSQQQKGMKYWHMQQYEGISKSLYGVKEAIQKKKKKYICMIFMWNSKKCKWIYSARKQSGYLGIGGKWVMARGWNYKGTQRNFWGDRCVLIVLSEVMVSWVHRHVKTYQIVYFKYMNLLYVNCTSIKVFFKKGNFFLNLFFLNVEMIILSFY